LIQATAMWGGARMGVQKRKGSCDEIRTEMWWYVGVTTMRYVYITWRRTKV